MKRKPRHEENGFERWGGYMNAKITKLEEQFEEESKKLENSGRLSNIFKGISIFVNGYTEPSSDDLRDLMLLHGGTFHHYYRSKKTTHMIASNLPHAKIMQMETLKVVKPEWIVQSIEAGKLLDYKKFLLFNDLPSLQSKLKFSSSNNDNDNNIGKEKSNQENVTDPHSTRQNQKVAKTAVDPEFLTEFYSNSRLHHISEMGAMFKQYVGELKEKHDGNFPGRERIKETYVSHNEAETETGLADRIVMHIDMDCFFASVAIRDRPELVGKPVAVTHARGNPTHQRAGTNRKFEYEFYKKRMEAKIGFMNDESSESDESNDEERNRWFDEPNSMSEIASCSYEARKAGISNGMYLGTALKLCPGLITVPYDFQGYREVSYALYNIVAEYTLDIEAVSCDELYIDSTSLIRELRMRPLDFSSILRRHIFERTRCPSSVGIGANKLQARLATKRAKPNGQFHVTASELTSFMSEIEARDLPGVGRTTDYKLKNLGVRTCRDLQIFSVAVLRKEFGVKTGDALYKHCRGIDDGVVNSAHQRKSVSAEVNYGIRFGGDEEAVEFLRRLSTEVAKRLREAGAKGRSVTLKLMIRARDAPTETAKFLGHGACDYATRSSSMPFFTDDSALISKHVINTYRQMSVAASDLRGIGIQVTKLENCPKGTAAGTIESFLKGSAKLEKKKSAETRDAAIPSTSANARTETFPPEGTSAPRRNVPDGGEKLELPPLSQLDGSVFESLPNDLRMEIMNDYGVRDIEELKKCAAPKRRIAKHSNLTPVDPEVLDALPEELRDEVLRERIPRSELASIPFDLIKRMLREWVTSETEPLDFDANMLSNYFCDLVHRKKLESVGVLVKLLRRHIRDVRRGNRRWVETYRSVTERLQESMRKVFDKELFVQDI